MLQGGSTISGQSRWKWSSLPQTRHTGRSMKYRLPVVWGVDAGDFTAAAVASTAAGVEAGVGGAVAAWAEAAAALANNVEFGRHSGVVGGIAKRS